MPRPDAFHAPFTRSLLAGGIATLAIATLSALDGLSALEWPTEDWRVRQRGARETSAKIVIVRIGDRTLAEWTEPIVAWGPRFAATIDHVFAAGASQVGLDLIIQADPDQYLESLGAQGGGAEPLAAFGAALARHPGRITIANARDGRGVAINPAARLTWIEGVTDSVGFVDFQVSPDGVVRTMDLYRSDGDGAVPSFAAQLAARHHEIAADDPAALSALFGQRPPRIDTSYRINFTGRSFPIIEAADAAAGRLSPADEAALRDATVLIGPDHVGSQDYHRAPGVGLTPGVAVQAEALATLIDRAPLQDLGPSPKWALVALVGLAATVAAHLLRGFRLVALLTAVALAWTAASVAILAHWDLFLPVAAPLLCLAVPPSLLLGVRSTEERLLRARVEALFGRMISERVAKYVASTPLHQELGGSIVEGSVLFLDIRESTTYAESRPPNEVVEHLNEFYEAILPVVDRHNETVNKFLGDGFLAVFGAPYPETQHAQSALTAAVDILGALEALNVERSGRGLPVWRVGCGVHSGPMVQGNIGAADRLEWTVIGDTVNTAARLESSTKAFAVALVVSQATFSLAGSPDGFSGPHDLSVRGRELPIPVYTYRRDLYGETP